MNAWAKDIAAALLTAVVVIGATIALYGFFGAHP
jgi:hypothetical protein